MNTPYPELFVDLGTRLVACPQWRWLPRMRSLVPGGAYTVLRVLDGGCLVYLEGQAGPLLGRPHGLPDDCMGRPDLNDPPTLGCLESMVDGFRALKVNNLGFWWVVYKDGDRVSATKRYDSKGEAIARTLLQQWGY